MVSPYVSIPPAIVAALPIVILIVLALREQGKKLKFPSCGQIFNAASTDRKFLNLGLTFPYFGEVKCPRCGVKRLRKSYPQA